MWFLSPVRLLCLLDDQNNKETYTSDARLGRAGFRALLVQNAFNFLRER
jgi:hypothetical protein